MPLTRTPLLPPQLSKLHKSVVLHSLAALPDAAKDLIEPSRYFFDLGNPVSVCAALRTENRCFRLHFFICACTDHAVAADGHIIIISNGLVVIPSVYGKRNMVAIHEEVVHGPLSSRTSHCPDR
jgi:hypothetical protein